MWLQVFGVGGGGSNAVNNMVDGNVQGVELWVANTDAQVSAWKLNAMLKLYVALSVAYAAVI